MPIEIEIWRLGDDLQQVTFSSIDSEAKLEDTLANDISILSPKLMLIGRQITTAHGKSIDLLAIDVEGNLSVIELKKNQTPREVVAQVLDYASWVENLSYNDQQPPQAPRLRPRRGALPLVVRKITDFISHTN